LNAAIPSNDAEQMAAEVLGPDPSSERLQMAHAGDRLRRVDRAADEQGDARARGTCFDAFWAGESAKPA
jgi:hypothetical protein